MDQLKLQPPIKTFSEPKPTVVKVCRFQGSVRFQVLALFGINCLQAFSQVQLPEVFTSGTEWSNVVVFGHNMAAGVLEYHSPPEQPPAVSLCWPDHKMESILILCTHHDLSNCM